MRWGMLLLGGMLLVENRVAQAQGPATGAVHKAKTNDPAVMGVPQETIHGDFIGKIQALVTSRENPSYRTELKNIADSVCKVSGSDRKVRLLAHLLVFSDDKGLLEGKVTTLMKVHDLMRMLAETHPEVLATMVVDWLRAKVTQVSPSPLNASFVVLPLSVRQRLDVIREVDKQVQSEKSPALRKLSAWLLHYGNAFDNNESFRELEPS